MDSVFSDSHSDEKSFKPQRCPMVLTNSSFFSTLALSFDRHYTFKAFGCVLNSNIWNIDGFCSITSLITRKLIVFSS